MTNSVECSPGQTEDQMYTGAYGGQSTYSSQWAAAPALAPRPHPPAPFLPAVGSSAGYYGKTDDWAGVLGRAGLFAPVMVAPLMHLACDRRRGACTVSPSGPMPADHVAPVSAFIPAGPIFPGHAGGR